MTKDTPLPERIARILDRHNSSFRSDSLVGSAVRNVETTKQINLLLADFVNEVVGENEPEKLTPNIATSRRGKTYKDGIAILRNKLRKEQRKRAKDMLGEI